jgi:hypothetical protein
MAAGFVKVEDDVDDIPTGVFADGSTRIWPANERFDPLPLFIS